MFNGDRDAETYLKHLNELGALLKLEECAVTLSCPNQCIKVIPIPVMLQYLYTETSTSAGTVTVIGRHLGGSGLMACRLQKKILVV